MESTTFAHDLLERFLRYVAVDTMSDPHVEGRRPTTAGQMDLVRMVEREFKEFGFKDIFLDPNGYLIARLPSNMPQCRQCAVIGFMAHVDTADDIMGNGVKPRVVANYDGKDIPLNAEYSLKVTDNPELARYVGKTIVVTDGTTLLGADDKAGLAIMMAVARKLASDDSIVHGEVEFIVTTDEETGAGMDVFPIGKIRSTCCYTLDGGPYGEVEAECFNAATVYADFSGVPFHLGLARGKMVNSVTMAASFISAIPQSESPEATDGRYGYYCAQEIHGTAEKTRVVLYLRDFDLKRLNERIAALERLGAAIEALFPTGKVEVSSKHVYYNMYEAIKKQPQVMAAVVESARKLGIPLVERIIRGGTDGARLAELGVPAPNLFTGGHNYHSRYEWAALDAMVDAARLVEHIILHWAGATC